MSGTFTVGLVQMRSGLVPAANLDAATKLIGEAKAAGADYVQTPEMTNIVANKRDLMLAAIAAGGKRCEPRGIPRARARARISISISARWRSRSRRSVPLTALS